MGIIPLFFKPSQDARACLFLGDPESLDGHKFLTGSKFVPSKVIFKVKPLEFLRNGRKM